MTTAIEYLSKKDIIFKNIIGKYGVPIRPTRPQGFETLVLLILEQQVSINAAKATFLKLKTILSNFQPQSFINLDETEFRACGVSRQKTNYIKSLSSAIVNREIDLESLAHKTPETVRSELIKIKGIGNWTIDIYLMFALQNPDIIPLGDIAVVNTIKELLGIENKSEMESYTQKWAPHRSVATFLLWHYYLKTRNRTVEY